MKPIYLLLCYALTLYGGCAPLDEWRDHVPIAIDFQGVWTNPNASSKVPAGAARYAQNLVNPRPGVASTVPGMQTLSGSYEETDERFSTGLTYDGLLIESTSGAVPRLYRYDTSGPTRTAYTTPVSPPSGVQRPPMAVAGEKLYLATDGGVKVIDGVASEPAIAGAPPPLNARVSGVANVGTGTAIDASSAVAYRWTHVRSDSMDRQQESIPSGRVVVVNTNVMTADGLLRINISPEVVAGDQLRLYRTGNVAETVDPGDVTFLVIVHIITNTDVSNAYVEITDTTPDVLRGVALYTNANMGSIIRQNERPPLAKDLIAFDDYLVAANVMGLQRFVFRLLAPIQAGDIVTIAGQAYLAKTYSSPTDPDYTNGEFETTTGLPSVSENIYATAQALIDAINRTTANTSVYASYASSPIDPPGIIAIEGRQHSIAVFTVQASANGENYEPPLATAQSSIATTEENGLWLSKRGQHYAFPPLRSSGATYRFRVGSSGNPILKVAKIRNNLIVFVEKEGVWKVQRTGPETWRVDQINNNAHLLVPESVAVVDNQVIAWTTRGVVAIDETGVEEIDLPIKDQFDIIRALGTDVVLPYTFAVGDEGRLRYILYHPEAISDTTSTHAWVYNADQGTWTERTDDASGGFVGDDDGLLYLGSSTSNTLTQERTGTDAQVYKRPDNTAIPVRLELTMQDEAAPSRIKQYTDFVLITKDAITGSATFNFTNHYNGTESCTGSASASGEPFIHVWVPDGCQRTSRLKVDIRRDVLGQAFEVIGTELYAAGTYRGGMMR